MNWTIEYYNSRLQDDILKLPDGILARYFRLTDLMVEVGPNLGLPHTKALGDGLLELRLKSKEGISRVFYCSLVDNRIMMLHSFIKKSQKIPQKEIKLARQRLKEVKHDDT